MKTATKKSLLASLIMIFLGLGEISLADGPRRGGGQGQGQDQRQNGGHGRGGRRFDFGDVGRRLRRHEDGDFQRGRRQPPNGGSRFSSDIRMGQGRSLGEGCPEGTIVHSLSPDNKTLSILFSNYSNEVGGETRRQNARKNCAVSIPFEVPAGFQVAVVQIDYRGYNFLPTNGSAGLASNYQFTDSDTGRPLQRSIRRMSEFAGPLDENFTVSANFEVPLWSLCGRDLTLDVQTSLATATNEHLDSAMTVLDSADVTTGDSYSTYHLLWRECQEATTNPDFDGQIPPRRRPARGGRFGGQERPGDVVGGRVIRGGGGSWVRR